MPNKEIARALERCTVQVLIEEMDKAGFIPVRVWDGAEYIKTRTMGAVESAVSDVCGTPTIHFASKAKPSRWGTLGVLVVPGNGESFISDWHCGNEEFDAAVNATCKRMETAKVVA